MEKIFGVAAILLSTSSVHAYIVEEGPGRRDSPFSTTDWSPKSFTSKIRIHPLGDPVVREDKINIDSNAEKIIRREYSAWTVRNGKVKDVKRFEIFRQNFVSQMEMNRKNGEFFLLNEYGDMTEEEFIALSQTAKEWKEIMGKEIGTTKLERVENLTNELLESMSESSRNSIPQKDQTIVETKKFMFDKTPAHCPIRQEKCLPEKFYSMLVDGIRKTILHEKESTGSPKINNAVFESYRELLYTPMQRLDDSLLRPSLISAAVFSASVTTRHHLIDTIWSELEET